MKKRFKSKKRIVKYLFYIILVTICYQVIYGVLMNVKLFSSNEQFLKALIENSNYYLKYKKNNNIVKKVTNFLIDIDINNPTTIIDKVFNSETHSDVKVEPVSKHISDPNPEIKNDPIIYIYNSHQLENYDGADYEIYNITPNVMMASYILKERLNELGVSSIVEKGNITEFLKTNNWNYNYSYDASEYFIKQAISDYPTLKYFIDIHRDSINKKESTVTIGDKNYARILFVVGLAHQNYQANLELANKINKSIFSQYPSICRGVLTKKGSNVNGIYNQDISPNAILLEIGGYQNTIDEVMNTINIIAPILKEIIANEI